jgi:hypothetical protein
MFAVMPSYRVEVAHESELSAPELFAALADHERLSRVFGVPVRRIRDGAGDVNGVGSVRAMGVGPLRLEETVTAVVPDREIEYRITRGGGPVKNHRGRVEVTKAGAGSRVSWTIEYDSLPGVGRAVELVLRRALGRGLKRLG